MTDLLYKHRFAVPCQPSFVSLLYIMSATPPALQHQTRQSIYACTMHLASDREVLSFIPNLETQRYELLLGVDAQLK